MAASDPDDVIRSLRRFVWLALGIDPATLKPWTVRTQRTRAADDQRPVAVVEEATPLSTPHSRATIPQGDVQKMQGFAVVCYPVLRTSAPESAQEARRVATLIDRAFSCGLVTDDVPPVNIGGPWRLPIYDFRGVPIVGDAATRQGPADPYMHANVDETFSVRAVPDAMDELRFTVVANVRLTWWLGGRIPPAAPIVSDIPPTSLVQR